MSFLGYNLNIIADIYGSKPGNVHELLHFYKLKKDCDACIRHVNSSIVSECIAIRDGYSYMDNFNMDNIEYFTNYWSTCELTPQL